MRLRYRVLFLLIALSLSFLHPTFHSVIAAIEPISGVDEERALRELIEALYRRYCGKDLEGYFQLWAADSPAAGRRREQMRRAFGAMEKMELLRLEVVRIRGDAARARVWVRLEIRPFVGGKAAEPQAANRSIECVAGPGGWRVRRDDRVEEEIAEALLAAKSAAEREALLEAERPYMNRELLSALIVRGDEAADDAALGRALEAYRIADEIAGRLKDRLAVARVMDRVGGVRLAQGDYPGAMDLYRQSLAIVESLGQMNAVFAILNNIGRVEAEHGNYEAALAAFQRSLALSEAEADPKKLAIVFNNLSNVWLSLGDYANAARAVRRGLALAEASGDRVRQAVSLSSLGNIHFWGGEDERAEEYYRQSLAMREGAEEQTGLADVISNLGVIHARNGRFDRAMEDFRRSLALHESRRDDGGVARALLNIGDVHRRLGQHSQALESYQQSLALREKLGRQADIATTLRNMAMLYDDQRRYDAAAPVIERALALARTARKPELLWSVCYVAGRVQQALGNSDAARADFEEAIATIEALRTQVAGGERQQERYFENKLPPYYEMVRLLIGQGRPGEALGFAERAKARVLLDTLQSGRVNIAKALTEAEQRQERLMNAEIVSLNTQLYRANAGSASDPARIASLSARLRKAQAEQDAFQAALYVAHPELKIQRGQAPAFDLQRTAGSLLDASTALLEYVVGDKQTWLFVITKGGDGRPALALHEIAVDRESLNTLVERFRRQLADHDLTFAAAASRLHRLLIQPAAAQLAGRSRLVIVRDAGLWELPFQALKNGAGRYLLEDFAVSYAPSLTALAEMGRARRARPASELALLAFGAPRFGESRAADDVRFASLPGAEQELRQLARIHGEARSRIYLGAEAREERLKAEAGTAGIVHLATHGVLDDANPMYSRIVLAQPEAKSGEDGLLQPWEVMKLDLRADLVVLSACETGRGRIGAGEGLIGLTWAFFVAGAPTTVVSQWKVDAARTSQLMLAFHHRLRMVSIPKAEALRQAELTLLRNPRYRHPFYWAGFSILGVAN
ncbi:MAG: CHAT domain-containing protein [Blastocatellia bacterium]|nr:CHAT domain-containing protein [Blastocatellia bacterium]